MSDSPKTLDLLIRRKVEKELGQEISAAFGKVFNGYFAGSSDRYRMFVVDSSDAIRESTKPGNPEVQGYTVDLLELFKVMRDKATANELTRRGDAAVQEFMERVESLGEEIDELRGRVLE